MSLKHRTAGALKWNVIDRISSQVLYALTGVVLARELSPEAFGMVGALTVFQSFALLFVDSGFSWALIQRKRPTELDYSSVFWFNLMMAVGIYLLLYVCAYPIATLFGSDQELVPLSRVMFLTFIINALSIVQVNRLMKQMDVRPIAVANFVSLAAGGVVGIWMAMTGYGAWSIVWQAITLNSVKALWLWTYCRWTPVFKISLTSLRGYFKVGAPMMGTSFLNVLFQNIYSFFIGNRAGLVPLGYYTQGDKWSKMGITSMTQIITSTFLPTLSEVQDEKERFCRIVGRINQAVALLIFPSVVALILMSAGIFHILFGDKWDLSILMFQLLLIRGVFTILNTLCTNYLLAVGRSGKILWMEIVRDVAAILAIAITIPFVDWSHLSSAIDGLNILLLGQVAVAALTWGLTIFVTSKAIDRSVGRQLADMWQGLLVALLLGLGVLMIGFLPIGELAVTLLQGAVSAAVIGGVLLKYRRFLSQSAKD